VPPSGILCLSSAQVISSAATPRVSTVFPCGVGQLPVYLSSSTQILDASGAGATMALLQAGDTLRVNGTLANAQFTAATVQDLSRRISTPPPSTQLAVQGTLAAAPNPVTVPPSGILCLSNAQVISSAITPRIATVSPCPVGQLPVYLSSSTQILDASGAGATMALLQAGDMLRVSGTLANAQFTAAIVHDGSRNISTTPPPTTRVTVKGTLVAAPSQLTAPVILCLQNAHVINSRHSYRIQGASTCPLPVYVTTSTSIHARYGGRISLDLLRAGDTLQVEGTIANAQLIASTITNLSLQRAYNTLVGTVLYVNPSTPGAYFTMRIQQPVTTTYRTHSQTTYKELTAVVYVQRNTQFVSDGTLGNQVTVLNPGDAVTVYGLYNSNSHHCNTTYLVRVH
jgi:hypothetical protein